MAPVRPPPRTSSSSAPPHSSSSSSFPRKRRRFALPRKLLPLLLFSFANALASQASPSGDESPSHHARAKSPPSRNSRRSQNFVVEVSARRLSELEEEAEESRSGGVSSEYEESGTEEQFGMASSSSDGDNDELTLEDLKGTDFDWDPDAGLDVLPDEERRGKGEAADGGVVRKQGSSVVTGGSSSTSSSKEGGTKASEGAAKGEGGEADGNVKTGRGSDGGEIQGVILGTGKRQFQCKIPPKVGVEGDRLADLARGKLAVLNQICVKLIQQKFLSNADAASSPDEDPASSKNEQICFENGEAFLRELPRTGRSPSGYVTPLWTKSATKISLIRDRRTSWRVSDVDSPRFIRGSADIPQEQTGDSIIESGEEEARRDRARRIQLAKDAVANNGTTAATHTMADGVPPPTGHFEASVDTALQKAWDALLENDTIPMSGIVPLPLKGRFLPHISVGLEFAGERKIVCECAPPTEKTRDFLLKFDSGKAARRLATVAIAPDRIISPACCSYQGVPPAEDLLWYVHTCARFVPQTSSSNEHQRSWWTSEVCLPRGKISQFHVTPENTIHGSTLTMGTVQPASFRKTADSLMETVDGGPCSSQFQLFTLKGNFLSEEARAYGGTFNPLHEAGFAGPLAHEVKNEHGCDAFEKRYEGAVVVVKRGKCWFHEKSIRAQEAGAIGLIIANDNRPMADIMEGVESLPAPYIISVLVERDVGLKMLDYVGKESVAVSKWVNDEHPPQISTFLTFHCSPDWNVPVCPEGTPVEVLGETERGWRHAIVQKELPDMENLLVLQGKVATVEKVVPRHAVFRAPDFQSCASLPLRVEQVDEPKNCQANIRVHVASLCGHNELIPVRRAGTATIQCGLPDVADQTAPAFGEGRAAGTMEGSGRSGGTGAVGEEAGAPAEETREGLVREEL